MYLWYLNTNLGRFLCSSSLDYLLFHCFNIIAVGSACWLSCIILSGFYLSPTAGCKDVWMLRYSLLWYPDASSMFLFACLFSQSGVTTRNHEGSVSLYLSRNGVRKHTAFVPCQVMLNIYLQNRWRDLRFLKLLNLKTTYLAKQTDTFWPALLSRSCNIGRQMLTEFVQISGIWAT